MKIEYNNENFAKKNVAYNYVRNFLLFFNIF